MNAKEVLRKTGKRSVYGFMTVMALGHLSIPPVDARVVNPAEVTLKVRPICARNDAQLDGLQIAFDDEASQRRSIAIYAADGEDAGFSSTINATLDQPARRGYIDPFFINKGGQTIYYQNGKTYTIQAFAIPVSVASRLESQSLISRAVIPPEATLVAETKITADC